MKKREIEIGKIYAAAAPNRSHYAKSRAARVSVIAVGVFGRSAKVGRTERENFVLVEDLSRHGRRVARGEFGMESTESGLSYPFERITAAVDERMEGYYSKLLPEDAPYLRAPEKAPRIYAVPYGWILEPWETFELAAIERIKGEREDAERREKTRDYMDGLVEKLREGGLESAAHRIGGIQLNAADVETVLELIKVAREAQRLYEES